MKTATCNIHSVTVYNTDGSTNHFTFNLEPYHPRKPRIPDWRNHSNERPKRQAPRLSRYRNQRIPNTVL